MGNILKNVVQKLMTKDKYHSEFSHTVLHNQQACNVNKSNLMHNFNNLKMIDIENPNTVMINNIRNSHDDNLKKMIMVQDSGKAEVKTPVHINKLVNQIDDKLQGILVNQQSQVPVKQ